MNRLLAFTLSIFMLAHAFIAADDGIIGFWKTVDEVSGKAQSVVAVYQYDGRYFGRLILSYDKNGSVNDTIYNPRERAPGVVGDPYYMGLDIIFNLKKVGNKYTDGSIIDPQKGNKYGAELWVDENNLIVRGKLLFFGRNQTWPPAEQRDFPQGFVLPDISKFVPVIPKVK